MAALVIRASVATMADASEPFAGRVWIRDGRIIEHERSDKTKAERSDAAVVDAGDVLPGFSSAA